MKRFLILVTTLQCVSYDIITEFYSDDSIERRDVYKDSRFKYPITRFWWPI